MDGAPFPPASEADPRHEVLIARHAPTLAAALEAIRTRKAWSPYSDSPSSKIHGEAAAPAGRAAFEARLGQDFDLDQPGDTGARVGEEISPYTGKPLGIRYPVADPDALVAAAVAAWPAWRRASPELRIALCLEMSARLYARNFEMAQAIMHTTGQS